MSGFADCAANLAGSFIIAPERYNINRPREIVTPFRHIPLETPEEMKHNELFNSTENLADLVNNNGLLVNAESLLLHRKALGHIATASWPKE